MIGSGVLEPLAASLVDTGVTLTVAVSCRRAAIALIGGQGIEAARLAITSGVVAALNFGVTATLLRTIVAHTWPAIGTLATVYALRTIVKRAFAWERANSGPSATPDGRRIR